MFCFGYRWGCAHRGKTVAWARFGAKFVLCFIAEAMLNSASGAAKSKWRKKAEKGDSFAQCNLGMDYYFGEHEEQSYEMAVYWFTKSAEQGYGFSLYLLGLCYRDGTGVEQDYIKAIEYFNGAVEQGVKDAQKELDVLMSISGADYLETETLKGSECYGRGDYEGARKHYLTAAKGGDVLAQFFLGCMYYEGDGVDEDIKQAIVWLEKASDQGFPFAKSQLSILYASGQDVARDADKSIELAQKAAEIIGNGEHVTLDKKSDFVCDINTTGDGVVIKGLASRPACAQDIVVSDTVEGIPVTEIDSWAFSDEKFITSIRLPNTLLKVGNSAFYGCTSLKDLYLPDTLEFLGWSAFAYCTLLKTLRLPGGNKRVWHSPDSNSHGVYWQLEGDLCYDVWVFYNCVS